MRKAYGGWGVLLVVGLLAVWPSRLTAQSELQLVTGEAFTGAVPDQIYLEARAIPVQKQNAAFLLTSGGSHVLFALLDTSRYLSDVQDKYKGMIITEGKVSVEGAMLSAGSYGFAIVTPSDQSTEAAKFTLYNQADEKIAVFAAKKDAQIKQALPLQVAIQKDGTAKLYLGRDWIGLK